jgi:hypothetical protein
MTTVKRKKLTVKELVGNKVRLYSPLWSGGYCDGFCNGYDKERSVLYFRPEHANRIDDVTYLVRAYGHSTDFELL